MKLLVLVTTKELDLEQSIESCIGTLGFMAENARDRVTTQMRVGGGGVYACIIDCGMGAETSIQLFKFIKSNSPKTKIIFLIDSENWGEEYDLNRRDFYRLGVNSIIVKKNEFQNEILNALSGSATILATLATSEKLTTESPELKCELPDDQFFSIPIERFSSASVSLFDIYVKTKPNHYIKILFANEIFDDVRLENYKKKGVTELYIDRKEHLKYIDFCQAITERILKKSNFTTEQKSNVVRTLSEQIIQDTHLRGLSQLSIERGKLAVDSIHEMVSQDKNIGAYLRQLKNLSPNDYTHSFLTTLFTSCIMQALEWKSETACNTILMASLLHDIGKVKLPSELLKTPRKEMNATQLLMFEKHPVFSAEMAESSAVIPPGSVTIMAQHHEARDGSGYPQKLKGSNIHLSSAIVIFANVLADEVLKTGESPETIFKNMLNDKRIVELHFAEVLRAFAKSLTNSPKNF